MGLGVKKEMKALILAKGYGTRIKSIIEKENIPKPLITIKNKSIIEHIVDNLNVNHINEIIVNVHYLSNKIIDCLQDRVLFDYSPLMLSHSMSIIKLRYWLKDDLFFVINGDTISSVNYQDMVNKHQKGAITALMDRNYRCGGTWLYDNDYFVNKDIPIIPYYDDEVRWFDVGTPEKLEIVKQEYEKPTSMP